jgi:hypothetical protein
LKQGCNRAGSRDKTAQHRAVFERRLVPLWFQTNFMIASTDTNYVSREIVATYANNNPAVRSSHSKTPAFAGHSG